MAAGYSRMLFAVMIASYQAVDLIAGHANLPENVNTQPIGRLETSDVRIVRGASAPPTARWEASSIGSSGHVPLNMAERVGP